MSQGTQDTGAWAVEESVCDDCGELKPKYELAQDPNDFLYKYEPHTSRRRSTPTRAKKTDLPDMPASDPDLSRRPTGARAAP